MFTLMVINKLELQDGLTTKICGYEFSTHEILENDLVDKKVLLISTCLNGQLYAWLTNYDKMQLLYLVEQEFKTREEMMDLVLGSFDIVINTI